LLQGSASAYGVRIASPEILLRGIVASSKM
jgi:hypothetical protein